jgi:hypothetical protein
MPKTYTAAGTVAAGDVYTAAAHNIIATDVNNFIVPPACRVYNTAAINPYTSNALITWNAEEYDTDEMHSTVSNTSRITIQTAGVYSIAVLLRGSWSGTMTSQAIAIMANGAEHSVHEVFGISTTVGGSWMTVSTIDDFAANDYIEARWGLGGATSPQVLTPSRLAVSWIGRTS